MDELRALYQEFILDHGKHPRNFRSPQGANRRAEGYNPLCGDRVTVELRLRGDVIEDIGFQGQGCAISTAAASTMTEAVKGLTVGEARDLMARYLEVVKGGDADFEALDKLAVFAGVAEFPMRVKCATLAWHTLRAAVDGGEKTASTE